MRFSGRLRATIRSPRGTLKPELEVFTFMKTKQSRVARQIQEKLAAALRGFGVDRRSQVVVAFSGGVDSAALLWALRRLSPHRRPHVEAVCVDHGLREESAEHARRAIELARSLGVEGRVVRVACRGEGGIEAAARRARYAALARVAEGRPILTAHTADDQAETVLYRLAKGAGRRGLGGIRPRASIGGGRVLRPLLSARRRELEAVVRAARLPVVEDPSNAAPVFVRNRIRHEVLPLLEAAVPGAGAGLARAAALAREDEAYLSRRARRAGARIRRGDGLDARALARLPRALSSRILRDLAAEAEVTLASRQIEAVQKLLLAGGEARISGAWVMRCRGGVVSLRKREREGPGTTKGGFEHRRVRRRSERIDPRRNEGGPSRV